MPWDFSVLCSFIQFELFYLSFSPAERSTDSEKIILWVSHEIEEMDIIDAKSCNSVADDVSHCNEMELTRCVDPRVPVSRITHSFQKTVRVFSSTGYWNFSEWGGFEMTCPVLTHARADGEHHGPSEALDSGIWLHAAFLNCIKLNANENDICLPKQCFAATFHAHTHKMGRGLGTKSPKTSQDTVLCYLQSPGEKIMLNGKGC